jgi:2-methylcitrate dehydratase PrpD
MTATARLLDFARADHRIGETTRQRALELLADTLAVGAAGTSESDQVVEAVLGWGAGEDARLLGADARLPAASAAFVNGFRIHCLEWDAVHAGAVVHSMSVVTAALGAAIDRRGGCDPDEALAALAVGVDIASGLGVAANGAMRFFRPATAGVIGAALAVARIMRTRPIEDVLGLAYSHAAGTMQAHVEGSIALPLQIANAARAAIACNDLVAAGLSGPHDALEGPFGYFALIESGDLSRYTSRIGERWLIEEVGVKPYPSGRASHASLATLAQLREHRGLRATDIDRIELIVPPLIKRLVGRPAHADMTPAYARLSLQWLAVMMLNEGRIDPRQFDRFDDPDLLEAAARISVVEDGSTDANALEPQRLIVTTRSGERIETLIEHTLGSPEAPLDEAQRGAKLALARELAGEIPDERIFSDPLAYFTEPQ